MADDASLAATSGNWLACAPPAWLVARLKDACRAFVAGGTPESDNPAHWADGEDGTPWVAIGDMTAGPLVTRTNRALTRTGLASKRLTVLPSGTILYSMYASLGKVAVLAMPAATNQAILGVVPDDRRLEATFLRWWLESLEPHVRLFSSSNTQDNLNAETVRNMPVYLPSMFEQRAIADFLDRETEKIDALVAKKQRLIELLQEKRTALISHAVAKGLDADVPMKDSGVEWLGQIPSHWDAQPLARCLRRITYGFTNPMPSVNDGPYMLTANDIGDGEVQWDTARRTTREAFAHELTAKSRPEPGDVLVTKDGTLGRVALHDGRPACVNQSVAVLRPATNLVSAFLLHVLRAAPYQWKMVHDAGGTTIKHIYITRLAKMPVAVPPMGEQQAIVKRVTQATGQLGDLERIMTEAIERLREYRSALITAAVTGQIDVSEYAKEAI